MKVGSKYFPVAMGNRLYLAIEERMVVYAGLSWDAKAVFSKMYHYARFYNKDHCIVSQAKLAKDLGMSRGKVCRAIEELLNDKWIIKVAPSGKERLFHYNNKYYFIVHPAQLAELTYDRRNAQ